MRAAITLILGALLVSVAFAEVADFDNIPYSPGVYVQGYPMYSSATKFYDADGDAQDWGGTWSAFGLCLRPAYYGMMNENRWMVSAAIPFNSVSPAVGDAQSGIGDIQLSAAYWFIDDHRKGTYLSFWLWADLPVGDDAKGLGTGQVDIRPGLAYAMEKFPYQVQVSAYYNLRMKNSDTEIQPGNEIWANADFSYGFNENMWAGAALETGFGSDWKADGTTWTDSKEQWFYVGPQFNYQVNPNVGLKFAGLYNVMGKNTAQAFNINARITWGF